MIQQIAFIIILVAAIYIMRKRVLFIHRTINLGKDKLLKDNPGERLKNMLLVAFGQKKMFKRPVPAILHLFIYIGFLVIN
ncbi:MAG TPA: Fe-S oxidoreductase, partial [Chryseolinea sp.]|nr:Fe-S oxidoreductase [Chryseolinea sp.]